MAASRRSNTNVGFLNAVATVIVGQDEVPAGLDDSLVGAGIQVAHLCAGAVNHLDVIDPERLSQGRVSREHEGDSLASMGLGELDIVDLGGAGNRRKGYVLPSFIFADQIDGVAGRKLIRNHVQKRALDEGVKLVRTGLEGSL